MLLLYSAALGMLLLLRTLIYLRPTLRGMRDPEELRNRFGRVPDCLRRIVYGRHVIWLHAESVGEMLCALRLVEELQRTLREDWLIVVSSMSRTGQALARERFGEERVFYMPLDFAFAVRPFLRILRPSVLVLIESEVTPRLAHECRAMGVPVVVVNARVSDRSITRPRLVRWLWSRRFRMASLWLAQSDEDARRLIAMDAPAHNVRVGGNLKFDAPPPTPSAPTTALSYAAVGRKVIVAGSTVGRNGDDEERIVLHAWRDAVVRGVDAMLVIAPRHPERFDAVVELAKQFQTVRATDLCRRSTAKGVDCGAERADVVVLDTIGDLASVYGIADIAFVGGSLLSCTGHNPLEPARFGVPVVMGPGFDGFREIVNAMRDANGICIVRDANELSDEFFRLLAKRADARAIGDRARHVFNEHAGATNRAVDAVIAAIGTNFSCSEVRHPGISKERPGHTKEYPGQRGSVT